MKASELARLLERCSPDTEIFIETEDGYTHEFTAVERPAVFDGFDTVYDEGINFKMTD